MLNFSADAGISGVPYTPKKEFTTKNIYSIIYCETSFGIKLKSSKSRYVRVSWVSSKIKKNLKNT